MANDIRLTEQIVFVEGDYSVEVKRDDKTGRLIDATIRGAMVLQERSRNGRVYTLPARKASVPLYERIPVHISHGTGTDYEHRAGDLQNSRIEESAPHRVRADYSVNVGHPLAEQIVDDALKRPGNLALSHEISPGEYEAEYVGEELHISDIHKIDVVAIVTDGGVNSNIKEHVMPQTNKTPSRKQIEKVAADTAKQVAQETIEECSCQEVDANKDDLQEQVNALKEQIEKLTKERDELLAKVEEFEKAKQVAERRDAIVIQAKELSVEVDDELMEDFLSMDAEKVSKFLKRLVPADQLNEEEESEDGDSGERIEESEQPKSTPGHSRAPSGSSEPTSDFSAMLSGNLSL